MRKTNGMINMGDFGSLLQIIQKQQEFQKQVTGLDTPIDSVQWFSYHIQGIQEELGEILKADKRWKTHRNAFYDRDNKLEEISDLFITAINIALFSGIGAEELCKSINLKINENMKKLKEANK